MKIKFGRLRLILLVSLTAFLSHATHGQEQYTRIPVWRVQMMTVELIQFDSLKREYKVLKSNYGRLQSIVSEQDQALREKDYIIAEKLFQLDIKNQQMVELGKFEGILKKYKRQRNLWGGAGVLATVTVLVLKR